MQQINIAALPRQEIIISLNAIRWLIRIKEIGEGVVADISANGVILFQGLRVVGNTKIIPYKYMEADRGNFILRVPDNSLIDWQKFGETNNLFYFYPAEIAELEAGRYAEWGF